MVLMHPLVKSLPFSYQRRYMTYFGFVLNKVIPMCAQTVPIILSTYAIGSTAYKSLHGWTSIDPLRGSLLSKYYGFPSTFMWTESTIEAWRRYKEASILLGKTDAETVEGFIELQIRLKKNTANFIKKLESLPALEKDKFLEQMGDKFGVDLNLRRRKTD
jgi:hypothetical protein